jgi:hypothetical protein
LPVRHAVKLEQPFQVLGADADAPGLDPGTFDADQPSRSGDVLAVQLGGLAEYS